jgi:cellobiose phosphorylase
MAGHPASRYGWFSEDGREFRIHDPHTPRPWSNIVASPRMGFAVSQTGGGFSWIDNSQLAVLTRWSQDFARDDSGRALYVRDAESGALWSLAPAPVWAEYDVFRCDHGIGYTVFRTVFAGTEAAWTLYLHPSGMAEIWKVELRDLSGRRRQLDVTGYLEWCCGVAPAPRREFHKLFLETRLDEASRAIFAENHMWDVPSDRWGHWNSDFPYTAAFACTEPLASVQGDKAAFLGRNGSPARPDALGRPSWEGRFGRHEDPVAALRCRVDLESGGHRVVGFVLAADSTRAGLEARLEEVCRVEALEPALEASRSSWRDRLAIHRIETPEPILNCLVNEWVRYQAISSRLWGRCGYYQQSGAYGFRDQLQDSQVWLTLDPARCRDQVSLNAAHQFTDGSVVHWWHPLSERGLVTRMTDDLLWLGFVAASYIRETGDLTILDDAAPFLDDPGPAPLRDHILRAFRRVFSRTSPRGIPYLGAGDWNDGLSAAGLQERGESFWLGHFLAGLLRDWAGILRLAGDASTATEFEGRRERLVEAINEHGWDGAWYLRGTLDNGQPFGSARNPRGRIYLNAQTWALLSEVAPPDRAASCWAAVKEHLVREMGALLLAPAYDRPTKELGYITRYAPGMRENGGVDSHAAVWAVAAACKVKDAGTAGRLLHAMNPALKDPERYWAEPYVLPGNVDGPDSPRPGRGGWTWYTGAAAWFHRVVAEWVLGIRPELDGLRVDPCLPPSWPGASAIRPWRGATYRVTIERDPGLEAGSPPRLEIDRVRHAGRLLPVPTPGERHEVRVVVPAQA